MLSGGGLRRSLTVGAGSISVISPWTTPTGSRSSVSGHILQRGRPLRSRKPTRRTLPQAVHSAVSCPQTEQYQSWPWRWRVRSVLPHSAQTGGAIAEAPALRSSMSRSPMARGAGDRPSVRTAVASQGLARFRDFARPPATAVTTARTVSVPSPFSTSATRSAIRPTGSATARSRWSAVVTRSTPLIRARFGRSSPSLSEPVPSRLRRPSSASSRPRPRRRAR